MDWSTSDLEIEEADVLLESKNAVINRGGGAIGGAVARAFVREGAAVLLAGRTPSKLYALAEGAVRVLGGASRLIVDVHDRGPE